MVRLILVVITLVIIFLLSLIALLIGAIAGLFSKDAKDRFYFRSVQIFCHMLLFAAGVRTTVIGREKMPKEGAYLYIGNHRSLFDIPLTITLLNTPAGYVAKKEFEKTPLLSWWIRGIHGYFIDRDNVREALKTILAGIEDLKSGRSIAVFPEGTRSKEADETQMLEFHEGTFKLATKAGVPIIPMTISGASRILEDHFPKIVSTHVIVEIGDPIDTAALSKEEKKFVGRYVRGIMMETMARNHDALMSR